MSYIQSFYHIVFRTYRSEQTIVIEHDRELYAVIMEQTNSLHGKIYRIGGMPDHVHIFVSLPATISVAQYVQAVKTFTSKWLKANPAFPHFSGWAHEYAAFSYSIHDKDRIVNYIKGQKEHHKRVSFEEEYRALLEESGLVIRYYVKKYIIYTKMLIYSLLCKYFFFFTDGNIFIFQKEIVSLQSQLSPF